MPFRFCHISDTIAHIGESRSTDFIDHMIEPPLIDA